jgi:hypothetical protein
MTIVCVDDHPIMLKGLSKNIEQILPDAPEHYGMIVYTNNCHLFSSFIAFM